MTEVNGELILKILREIEADIQIIKRDVAENKAILADIIEDLRAFNNRPRPAFLRDA
jgi:hypothetical protein